jgi:hypothetical protein
MFMLSSNRESMAKKQLRKDLESKMEAAISGLAETTDKKIRKAIKKASHLLADAIHDQPVKKKVPAQKKAPVEKKSPLKKAGPAKKTVPKKVPVKKRSSK